MDDLLYRIFNRIIILDIAGQEYIVSAPDSKLRYLAELYQKKILIEYKYDLPSAEVYNRFLIEKKFIDSDYETKIKNMNDGIRKLKKDLFLCGPRIEQEKRVRKSLDIMRNKFNIYVREIDFHKRPTLENFAENQKNKFILINTIKDSNNNQVFDTKSLDLAFFNLIIEKVNSEDISSEQFRKIARSDNWQGYYRSNKYNLFNLAAIDLSEDQKILLMYTRMYESIWQHSETPEDRVIEDDDLCDGFLIYQQDKNKEALKKNFTNIDDKYSEVFLSAESQDEADSIYNNNSTDGRRILKERARVLKSKERVIDSDFIDNKLDILSAKSMAESAHITRK